MVNYLQTAQQLYSFLKHEIPNLPPFFFQIGQLENKGIIFTIENYQRVYFNNEIQQFNFRVEYFDPNENVWQQLEIINKIYEILTSENFKNGFEIEGKKLFSYMLNEKPVPILQDLNLSLQGFGETNQIYNFTLTIFLL